MANKSLYFLLILTLFYHQGYTQDTFKYDDRVYDNNIKTVQLYPNTGQQNAQIINPVIPLGGNLKLILEFDELYNEAYNYQAKIIHCNANWANSGLSSLQYLTDYNEYNINNNEYSFGTLTPYVHYTFQVPKPTKSGNYLLVVYAEGDPEDVILTRRFMVYEQMVNISNENEIRNRTIHSLGKQHLQFDVKYNNLELINPMDFVSVNILQNHRWDNAKMDIKPSFVRESQKLLEYNHFSDKSAFDAGNEFRAFDIRSLRYFGYHVATVKYEKEIIYAWIEDDKPRANLAYSIEQNINGQYFIENLERKIADIENDYAIVNFRLKTENLGNGLYLSGSFTDWQLSKEQKMEYNESTQAYEGSVMLKQGQYNYQYIFANPSKANEVEGNKSDTRNLYEILVYYRSPTLMADLLIGYQLLDFGVF